jgi:TonB family protein
MRSLLAILPMKTWIAMAFAACLLVGCVSTDPLQPINPVSNEVHFTGAYLTPDQVDSPPVATDQVPPDYPAPMRRNNLDGKALVALIVLPNGKPDQVQLVEATHPLFADAAVEAVRHWHFKPAMKNGQPVAASMQLPIEFRHDLDPASVE